MITDPTKTSKRFRNFVFDNILILVILYGIDQVVGYNGFLTKVIVVLVYYISFELVTGKTPGKMNTKTRVVMQDGSQLTFGAVFIRTIVRIIPFEALSFLGSKNPIGWHDKWSKTRVVEDI